MGIIWTIIIGFIAGVIAKLVTPGSNEPSGFILTTVLGIVGAFVASWLGQALDGMAPAKARSNRRCRRSNNRPGDLGCRYAAADARPHLIAIPKLPVSTLFGSQSALGHKRTLKLDAQALR